MVICMKIILDNTVDLAPFLAKDSIYDEIYLKSEFTLKINNFQRQFNNNW